MTITELRRPRAEAAQRTASEHVAPRLTFSADHSHLTFARPAERPRLTLVTQTGEDPTGDFRRYAVDLATAGLWVPWAEFADATRGLGPRRQPRHNAEKCEQCQLFTGSRDALLADPIAWDAARWEGGSLPYEDRVREETAWRHASAVLGQQETRRRAENSLHAWRVGRKPALAELDALGLAGTVVRSAGDVPLGEHEADLAGLVRVHPGQRPEPQMPAWIWHEAHTERAKHSLRMLAGHGLVPCGGIPNDLRGFCGQQASYSRPEWMDHAHTWLDAHGEPVLTMEPYAHVDNPAQQAAAYVAEAGLPLLVSGPHPGVWSARTALVILRYAPDVDVLRAEHQVYEPLTDSMVAA